MYVKEQLGHVPIQLTGTRTAILIPGAKSGRRPRVLMKEWRVTSASAKATRTQSSPGLPTVAHADVDKHERGFGEPGRHRTFNLQLTSRWGGVHGMPPP